VIVSLSAQQFQRLSELLVAHFDDKGEELDQVVTFSLGTGLFVDYAGRGSPFRAVVSQLLAKTEQKGSTAKLFGGVIRYRPTVRDDVAEILPEAVKLAPETEKHVADVLEGVRGVHAQLKITAVRERILRSFDDLSRTVVELDLLDRYKALHDCLHNLQIKHFRVVANAAKRLQDDPNASETLSEYLYHVQIQASYARTAAQGLPDTPGERNAAMGWIDALDSIISDLHSALVVNDNTAAIRAVYRLKAILRKQPADLDQLLVTTARRVPLSRLAETLKEVAETPTNGAAETLDLTRAIVALQRLIPDQMGLIAEHTAWQHVASDFWQADDALHLGNSDSLEEFQYVWESLWNKMLVIIASDPTAMWAASLGQQATEFIEAFPLPAAPPVPEPVKARFSLLQRDAMFQFFKIDHSLHRQCGEIVKLGEPLRRLLRDASNDSH
jgi:hypothetical protein